ncbi:DNA-3-methyladenine glycosylase [Siminovitchia fortis]|uniref:Putative 3-methyladenine DNA glycosylase n=1 Tax=Siminovitchia fortis TaxID=254758 RepID=A0A443IXK1_9BACI|nr:DNA-3-methyladenine glycosylase [Siminovitchia fortis]RWR12893.1 DNA-3-methyladenine glycosylase [Siminovitchia fortis]WHY80448.1 DNA-3-methyladenine glycosylase [Siminovitchia fortis]
MSENISIEPLNEKFFQQPTLELARSLLGCLLVKETEEGLTAGYIVETESYRGPHDRAAHSFGNRRTKRTEIMFGQAGLVYTYTMHTHCLINVVSAGVDEPEAVLIRALEPSKGIELMKRRRPVDQMKNLTNGPGKLTKAMGITMEDYGRKFFERPLFISEGISPDEIEQGTRIGIQNTGEARFYPWRFWIKGNQYVSK